MIVSVITLNVKPDRIEDFKKITVFNHENSVKEPGNLRFDVLQSRTDPGLFLLYEAYKCDEDVDAHRRTEHYKIWRDAVPDMLVCDRTAVRCNPVAPLELSDWE